MGGRAEDAAWSIETQNKGVGEVFGPREDFDGDWGVLAGATQEPQAADDLSATVAGMGAMSEHVRDVPELPDASTQLADLGFDSQWPPESHAIVDGT
jgi:hypothetical protein